MHILVALIVVGALLYGWLVGNWFARVLAFLAFTVILCALVLVRDDLTPPLGPIICVPAIVAAWFVSGLPEYYWRRQARRFTAAANLVP